MLVITVPEGRITMTTISNMESYYPMRSRIRDAKTEDSFSPVTSGATFTPDEEKSGSRGREDAASSVNSYASLASSLWDIEQLKSEATTMSGDAVDTSSSDRLLAELQEWSQLTPGEMIRAKLLEQLGLSEEEFAALPADERLAVEEKIKAAIKQSLDVDNTQSGNSDAEQSLEVDAV
jgi:hypothetical protein